MVKTKKISLVIVSIFVIPVLFIATASMAVTVTVQNSAGSSVSTIYYTQDGDQASGNADLVNGTINVTTSGSVERGLIRTQGGDGSRDFCPFTGDFEAGGTATGDSAGTTSSCTGTPRVNIFIVSQNPDHVQNCCVANFYDKIQDGVDAASGVGGRPDWVLVDDGTYKGAVIGSKDNLGLESVWGAADTTIDGRDGGATTLYAHDSPNLSIDGFTITGGDYFGSEPGNGLDVSNCNNVTIKNNTVADNEAHGIYVRYSDDATIKNNTVIGNEEDGIYVRHSDHATIQNNTVTGNKEDGIHVSSLSNNATIQNNTVTGNKEDGIQVSLSNNATIQNNISTGNQWNGIRVSKSNTATIKDNTVADNGTKGINVFSSTDATIDNNTVADNQHGGIYLLESTTVVSVNRNNIYGNQKYGLWNSTLYTVDATENWWGHAPPDYEGNLGVGVTGTPGTDIWDAGTSGVDGVLYDPWATEPY